MLLACLKSCMYRRANSLLWINQKTRDWRQTGWEKVEHNPCWAANSKMRGEGAEGRRWGLRTEWKIAQDEEKRGCTYSMHMTNTVPCVLFETKRLQVRKSRYLFSKKAEMKDIAVLLKLALGLWHMQRGVVLQSTGKCCKMIYKYSPSSGHDSC